MCSPSVTCFLLAVIAVCESSIKWEIKGKYVVYGKDATLTCYGNSCQSKAIKRWIGGPNYNLLCFDNFSTDSSKYKMMSKNTQPEFDLMIKSFNFSDANCEYTCSCGFLQYTKMLKLDRYNFIHLPVVEEKSLKQTDDTFLIILSMRVFPLPTCSIAYENKVFPLNLTINNITTGNGLELYRVIVQYMFDMKSYHCKGNLNLTCQVRSLENTLLQEHIDFCKDGNDTKYVIIGSTSSVFIVLITILAICVYRFGQ